MLNIEFKNPREFVKIISYMNELADSGTFEYNENGLNFTAMDACKISLATFKIHKRNFSHFECTKNGTFDVNLQSFNKILKLHKENDVLSLSVNNAKNSSICIKFGKDGTYT